MSSSADLSHGSASFQGRWFDGQSPVGRDARVEITPSGLSIRSDAADTLWPWIEVKQTRGAIRGEPVQFERRGAAETIVVQDPAILEAVRGIVPEISRHFRRPTRHTTAWRIALGVVALVASAYVVYAWIIPQAAEQLAQSVPVKWEEQFGAAVMESALLGKRAVDEDAIVAPLDLLMQRLERANPDSRYTYHLTVTDESEVNAFAGPGGYLVFNRGMLEFTNSPDELAAVLAHEMQHVERRHVTRGHLQSAWRSPRCWRWRSAAPTRSPGRRREPWGNCPTAATTRPRRIAKGCACWRSRVATAGRWPHCSSGWTRPGAPIPLASFLSTHPGGARRAQAIRAAATGPKAGAEPLLTPAEWSTMKAAVSARSSASPARDETPQTPSTPP